MPALTPVLIKARAVMEPMVAMDRPEIEILEEVHRGA
jgi:hypothetical protein